MGNVMAASPPPHISKEQMFGNIPPTEPLTRLQNPGTVEDIHKLCKDVFPINFEGAKLVLNKVLSNHFQVCHTINMSSVAKSGYKFGATYVGTKFTGPSEAYPIILGDIEPGGNLGANIIHQFTQRMKGKIAAQIEKSKLTALQMSADYRGDTFTGTLTVANPNILNSSGILVAHYLQRLSPSLALGGEIVYQRGPSIPGGGLSAASVVGRYSSGDSTISANFGLSNCHICFHQKASEQLQVGVELDINPRIQESTATIGYQIDLPKDDIVYKGTVDSNWTVGAVLEKRLQPLPFSFALSGILNHKRGQFQLGCAILI